MQLYSSLYAGLGRCPGFVWKKEKFFTFRFLKRLPNFYLLFLASFPIFSTSLLSCCLKSFFINVYHLEMKDPWHRTVSKLTHMYPHTHTYADTHKQHNTFKLARFFHMHTCTHTHTQTHTHTHTETHTCTHAHTCKTNTSQHKSKLQCCNSKC